MRMLRKKGTAQTFIWTPYLAMHAEMEEFNSDGDPSLPPVAPPSHITGGLAAAMNAAKPDPDPEPVVTNVYEITDKARLREMLTERNIVVAGNPSLKTLQDRLTQALEE